MVIPGNPDYPSTDDSLKDELPEGIHILKVPINEPSKWLKKLFGSKTKKLQKGLIDKRPGFIERILLWIRGNFFIPDARVSWVNRVVRSLKNDSAFAKAEYLITTGPPHSVHLIGIVIKKKKVYADLKWLADFRDPWTTIGYHKELKLTKSSRAEHQRLELKVLSKADQIIVTSPSTKAEFEAKTDRPIKIITNGFDLQPNDLDQPTGKFIIRHIGTLLSDRNPNILWEILSSITRKNPDFSKDFELQLAGNVSDSVLNSIKLAGLETHLKLLGYVNHEKAVGLMYESQVLLLIEIDDEVTKAIIPGKLFEYLASRRPIIAIGPRGSDVEQILIDTNAGHYFTYDGANLREQILACYKKYKEQELKGNAHDISNYHRKQLTQELVQILED